MSARIVRTNSVSSTSSDPLGLEDDRMLSSNVMALAAMPPLHFTSSQQKASPVHRDPGAFMVAEPSSRYKVRQSIAYLSASASAASTPARQPSPRPGMDDTFGGDSFGSFDSLPEGALESEQHNLTASFSAARTQTIDYTPPSISSMCLASGLDGGTAPLIIGDSSGRVVVFDEATNLKKSRLARSNSDVDGLRVLVSHRAFVPETDCLRSKLIEEKVTASVALKPRAPGLTSYLVSNESTIKLFRIRMKPGGTPPPRRSNMVPTTAFTGKHRRPIHSISTCVDQETFLSADDFVVNWWHLGAEDTSRATCLVDKTPTEEDVTEIYLSARFSPLHSSLFILGASSGRCDLGDLRDPPCRKSRSFTHRLQVDESTSDGSGYDDILLSVADAAFLTNEYVVTRDYMTCKLWDLRRPAAPVTVCPVMGSMRPHLEQLYDEDHIFHHFALAVDHRTSAVVTGLYDGVVALWYPQQQRGDNLEYYKLSQNDELSPRGGRVSRSDSTSNLHSTSSAFGPVVTPRTPSKSQLTESFFDRRVERVAISEGGGRITGCFGESVVVLEKRTEGPGSSFLAPPDRHSPFATDEDRKPAHERTGSRPLVPHSFRVPERLELKRSETVERLH